MTKTATRAGHVLILDHDAQVTRRTLEKVGFTFVTDASVARPRSLDITDPPSPQTREWDQVAHLEALFEAKLARAQAAIRASR